VEAPQELQGHAVEHELTIGPSRTQAHRQGCPLEETAGLLWLPIGVSGRFLVQHGSGTVVHGLRVCMRIANRSETCSSQLAQGTHHVKHHASLALLVEAQIVPDYDDEYSISTSSDSYGQSTEITVPVPG
jgi:hypothetical protein